MAGLCYAMHSNSAISLIGFIFILFFIFLCFVFCFCFCGFVQRLSIASLLLLYLFKNKSNTLRDFYWKWSTIQHIKRQPDKYLDNLNGRYIISIDTLFCRLTGIYVALLLPGIKSVIEVISLLNKSAFPSANFNLLKFVDFIIVKKKMFSVLQLI